MLLLFCEDAPTLPVTNDTLRGIGSRQEVQRERGFHTGREGGCEDEKIRSQPRQGQAFVTCGYGNRAGKLWRFSAFLQHLTPSHSICCSAHDV